MRPSVRFVGVCPARVAARPARRHEPRYGVRRCDRPIQPCPCLSGELFPAPAQDRPDPIQVVVLAAVVTVNLLLDTTPGLTFGRPQLYGITPHRAALLPRRRLDHDTPRPVLAMLRDADDMESVQPTSRSHQSSNKNQGVHESPP